MPKKVDHIARRREIAEAAARTNGQPGCARAEQIRIGQIEIHQAPELEGYSATAAQDPTQR